MRGPGLLQPRCAPAGSCQVARALQQAAEDVHTPSPTGEGGGLQKIGLRGVRTALQVGSKNVTFVNLNAFFSAFPSHFGIQRTFFRGTRNMLWRCPHNVFWGAHEGGGGGEDNRNRFWLAGSISLLQTFLFPERFKICCGHRLRNPAAFCIPTSFPWDMKWPLLGKLRMQLQNQ